MGMILFKISVNDQSPLVVQNSLCGIVNFFVRFLSFDSLYDSKRTLKDQSVSFPLVVLITIRTFSFFFTPFSPLLLNSKQGDLCNIFSSSSSLYVHLP